MQYILTRCIISLAVPHGLQDTWYMDVKWIEAKCVGDNFSVLATGEVVFVSDLLTKIFLFFVISIQKCHQNHNLTNATDFHQFQEKTTLLKK